MKMLIVFHVHRMVVGYVVGVWSIQDWNQYDLLNVNRIDHAERKRIILKEKKLCYDLPVLLMYHESFEFSLNHFHILFFHIQHLIQVVSRRISIDNWLFELYFKPFLE
jgi:hypothetical protein